jgi:miniconductance mechanosensitive channel
MREILNSYLTPFWLGLDLPKGLADNLNALIALVVLLIVILMVGKITHLAFLPAIHKIVKHSKASRDDQFVRCHFFEWLLRIVPVVIGLFLTPLFLNEGGKAGILQVWTQRILLAFLAAIGTRACVAFLEGIHFIYLEKSENSKRKSIKGYIQLLQILVVIVGGILIITTLANVSPVGILSGLGAMSAVLMLVFKDSILGLVSSIQLSHNDMVRLGDWIAIPAYNADGAVIDITLQSVLVQNWDNTVTTIPIYALVSTSFKNWRAMSESGGRRIERSIYINQHSVRFLKQEEFGKFARMPLLKKYMEKKIAEISSYNEANNIAADDYVSSRQLTNLGTFRAYVDAYLKALPQAKQGMTNMVRYLQPDQNGLQVEIYLFSADTKWENYEAIQADIIDHLLATLPEFGLRIFQNPSGSDLQAIADSLKKHAEQA